MSFAHPTVSSSTIYAPDAEPMPARAAGLADEHFVAPDDSDRPEGFRWAPQVVSRIPAANAPKTFACQIKLRHGRIVIKSPTGTEQSAPFAWCPGTVRHTAARANSIGWTPADFTFGELKAFNAAAPRDTQPYLISTCRGSLWVTPAGSTDTIFVNAGRLPKALRAKLHAAADRHCRWAELTEKEIAVVRGAVEGTRKAM